VKTIRMPKELLAKWLAALRSGEYTQTVGQMCNDDKSAFCCLGVLVEVSGGNAEDHCGTPNLEWRRCNDVCFSGYGDYSTADQPWLPALGMHAARANDDGVPFAVIANAIEACAEGY